MLKKIINIVFCRNLYKNGIIFDTKFGIPAMELSTESEADYMNLNMILDITQNDILK